jgi:hypothetical protein
MYRRSEEECVPLQWRWEGSGSLLALFSPWQELKMAQQKFAVGQLVDFDNRNSPARKPTGPYEIVRLLPLEDGGWQSYRIKSTAEPFERIAKEYEIVAIARQDARAVGRG